MFENLIDGFNTLTEYPGATVAHWLICGIAGWLTVHSHSRGGPMLRIIASHAIAFWICYEISEFAYKQLIEGQGDEVHKDLANGLFGYVIGVIVCAGYHKLRRLRAITILGFRIPLKKGA